MELSGKDRCIAGFIVLMLAFSALGCGQASREPATQTGTAGSAGLSTEYMAPSDVTEDDSSGSGFDVSGPKQNWIDWDADGDGVKEELLFEYHDNGDEAPSVIEITLYREEVRLQAVIDRAYGLNSILAKEDAEGPYLLIGYAMGDYYSHDAEGQCILRFADGDLVLLYENDGG